MKKLLLTGSALLVLAFANAQTPGFTTTGVYDDFSADSIYANAETGEEIYWYDNTGGTQLVLTRAGNGYMKITADGAGLGKYSSFGLNFGANGLLDLSAGADIEFDIENKGSDMAFMSIIITDADGRVTKYEPNVSDVTSTSTYDDNEPEGHYRRKALNGFTLDGGIRKTIVIDLSSVPGAVGGLTELSYDGCAAGPFGCPTTTTDSLDNTRIKSLTFMINFGTDNINLSEGDGDHTLDTFIPGGTIEAFTGDLHLHSFKMGSTVTGVAENMIENSISLFPNPAKDKLNVSFESNTASEVTLNDIFGNAVATAAVSVGAKSTIINTSNLTSGMYILNVATENGTISRKVIIE